MDIISIVKHQSELFLSVVKKDADRRKLNPLHHRFGGFPLLSGDNSLLYEQVEIDTVIESSIFRFLINGVLKELFSDDYCSIHGLVCEWTNIPNHILINNIDTIEHCYPYPVEFIILKDGNRTGYRYTNLYAMEDKVSKIFNSRNLNELVILDFSSANFSTFVHNNAVLSEVSSARIERVPFSEFFATFFSSEMYDIYLRETRKVIKKAYDYVGLITIPSLNSQYLPHFIINLQNEVCVRRPERFQYYIFDRGQLDKDIEERLKIFGGSVTSIDREVLYHNFFEEKRFLSLCGSEDFAHSFFTSEYLYHTLIENGSMLENSVCDFTAIVCGYLKSVEQLMYLIMKTSLQQSPSNIYIKAKSYSKNSVKPRDCLGKVRNKPHIPFKPEYVARFDTTFQPLVNFLEDYKAGWVISPDSVNLITTYLTIFCKECRNEHFHKDNISNHIEVGRIRDNTWLLLYWLISGIRYSENQDKVNHTLGILNRSFDSMYWAIKRKAGGGNYFQIGFSGKQPVVVAMPMNQKPQTIDKHGQLTDTNLRFVKLSRDEITGWEDDNWNNFEEEYSPEKIIILDSNNIPDTIYYIDRMTGNLSQIVW